MHNFSFTTLSYHITSKFSIIIIITQSCDGTCTNVFKYCIKWSGSPFSCDILYILSQKCVYVIFFIYEPAK